MSDGTNILGFSVQRDSSQEFNNSRIQEFKNSRFPEREIVVALLKCKSSFCNRGLSLDLKSRMIKFHPSHAAFWILRLKVNRKGRGSSRDKFIFDVGEKVKNMAVLRPRKYIDIILNQFPFLSPVNAIESPKVIITLFVWLFYHLKSEMLEIKKYKNLHKRKKRQKPAESFTVCNQTNT